MKVLLIEDNPGDARLVQELLKEDPDNYTVCVAQRLEIGLQQLSTEKVDIILLDMDLPDSHGIETLTKVQTKCPHLPVVVMTGSDDDAFAVQSVQRGAQDYLVKGQVDSRLLRRVLRYAMERKKIDDALLKVRDELELRAAELQSVNTALRDSRRAALNMMEDSVRARKQAEKTNEELQLEVAERKKAEEAIKQAAERWQITFDSIPDMVSIQDKDFKLVNVNKAYEKAFHKSVSQLKGKRCFEVVHQTICSPDNCPHKKTLKTKKVATEEIYEPLLGAYLEVTTSPLFDERGELFGTVHIAKDITNRKKVMEELKEYEEHLEKLVDIQVEEIREASAYNRGLLEASLDPFVTISPIGKIADLNKATEEATGIPRNQLIGSDFSDFFTEPEEARKVYKQVFTKGFVLDYPLAIRHESGQVMDVLYNATIFRNEAGEPQGVFAVARDVTERKRTEDALKVSMEQLHILETRLENIREEERKAISREVHDELGQILTALKMDLMFLRKSGIPDPNTIEQTLQSLLSLVAAAAKSVHAISARLRPGLLDDLGLVAAIEWQVEDFQKRSGIKCKANLPDHDVDIDNRRSTAIFRILQETLTNVARHSGAKKVTVSLSDSDADVLLSVKDDGIGITPDKINSSTSYGLLGIRERLHPFKGMCVIQSGQSSGTEVTIRLPKQLVPASVS